MNICEYGCLSEGKYFFPNVKRWCCSEKYSQCSAERASTSFRQNTYKRKSKCFARNNAQYFSGTFSCKEKVLWFVPKNRPIVSKLIVNGLMERTTRRSNRQLGVSPSTKGCTINTKKIPCSLCGKLLNPGNLIRHTLTCGVLHTHKCTGCENTWSDKNKTAKRKYCSDTCMNIERSKNASIEMKKRYANGITKPFGGGMLRHNHIKYDGTMVRVQGSYELRVCKILDFLVKNTKILKWEYMVEKFKYLDELGTERTYFPDFKIFRNNASFYHLEVKGYQTLRDTFKWQSIKNKKEEIQVWFKKDISSIEMSENIS